MVGTRAALLSVAAANTATVARSWGEVFSREHPLRPEVAAEHFRATRAGNPARTLQSRLLAYIPERAAAADRLETALQDNISRLSFLWGMQDSVSGAAIEGELRRRFPHVDIVAYHDAGHCPHLEVPERVAADVLTRTSSTERSQDTCGISVLNPTTPKSSPGRAVSFEMRFCLWRP